MSIDEVLQEGQELLVQVSKDPICSKGARVTSYLTFPGRYLVLMPDVEHVGIIQKDIGMRKSVNVSRCSFPRSNQRDTALSSVPASENSNEEEIGKVP